MAKKIIRFHGSLSHLLPEPLEVEADSVIEAFHAMVELRPELKQFSSFDDRPVVQVVGHETEVLLRSRTDCEILDVVPLMAGSGGGGGGFLKIVIGAVIIAATIAITGGTAAFASWAAFSSAWTGAGMLGSIALNLGVSLILGGLLTLISPVPRRDTGGAVADPEASKYLGAQKNTVRIGTRIPVGYGECRIPGHYLSFDSQAVDVAV